MASLKGFTALFTTRHGLLRTRRIAGNTGAQTATPCLALTVIRSLNLGNVIIKGYEVGVWEDGLKAHRAYEDRTDRL